MNRTDRSTRFTRRWVTIAAGASFVAMSGTFAGAQDIKKKPIKIGILAPYSGVFAMFGPKVIEEPIRLYLRENDNKIAVRPV